MLPESKKPTKPSQSTSKLTTVGMPTAFSGFLEPETFGESLRLTVKLDELSQSVFIDLRTLAPYPDWMQRLVIRYGPGIGEAIVVEVSATGRWSVHSLTLAPMTPSLDGSSPPNP
jgi:hypothetical protein